MQSFGTVSAVEMDRKKGFAYVDFADHEGLVKAMAASPVTVAQGSVQVLERKEVAAKKKDSAKDTKDAKDAGNGSTSAAATPAESSTATPATPTAPAAAPGSTPSEKASGEKHRGGRRRGGRGRGEKDSGPKDSGAKEGSSGAGGEKRTDGQGSTAAQS